MGQVAQETVKGIKWGFIQKMTLQPVQFIFGIILARLISPEEMGILGLTGIFFAIAGQLQNCGFGAALIRKQDRTDEDICTVFWYNVGMSAILSACIFASAPWLAWFYDQPALLNLTRVSALLMFLGSTSGVHYTLYSARRDFKTPALIGIIATVVPMPFTIWAAYSGWSYWSLMVQSVISSLLSLTIIWIISPWKPSFKWSWQSFRFFFAFGSRMAGAGLITTFCSELRNFIIGKFYSPAQLAFYSRAGHTCQMPISLTQGMLSSVTYPILSTLQDNRERLLTIYRRYIRLSCLVIEWCMLTMAFNNRAFIEGFYGEKWLPAAVYCQILCFAYMLNPINAINSNLYAVLGRTDILLRKEVIIRIYSLGSIMVGAYFSVKCMCYMAFGTAFFSLMVAIFFTSRICELKMGMQIADLSRYIIMALIANIPSYFIDQMDLDPFLRLLLGGSSSFGLYVLLLTLVKDQDARYLLNLALNRPGVQRLIGRFFRKAC